MFEYAVKRVRAMEWSVARALAWLSMNGYKVSDEERQKLEQASVALIPTV